MTNHTIHPFGIHWVPFAKVDQLPDSHGVYAWYYLPKMDVKKLKTASEEDRIDIVEKKIKIVQKSFERSSSWFIGKEYGGINNSLRGKKNSDILPRLVGKLKHDNLIHESPRSKASERPEFLEKFNKIIEKIGPFFFSPIYIGMTSQDGGLRHRVATHKTQFLEKKLQLQNISNPKRREDEKNNLEGVSLLGERMAVLELKEQYLWVAGFQLESESLSADDHDFLIFVEGFLNRLVHPIHGKK